MKILRLTIMALMALLFAGPAFSGTEEEIQSVKNRYESSRNMLVYTIGVPLLSAKEELYFSADSLNLNYRYRIWDNSGIGIEITQLTTPEGLPGYIYFECLATYFQQRTDLFGIGMVGWGEVAKRPRMAKA